MKDFFDQVNPHLQKLNANERKIFDYVVRDINVAKDLTVRELATQCYVSTTTIIRFCKKLGFEGYREFTEALKLASLATRETAIPAVLEKRTYYEEYAKNLLESIRVISSDKIRRFERKIHEGTNIFIYGDEIDYEPAHYCYCVLRSIGLFTYLITEQFEIRSALNQLKDGDMLMVFSLKGDDQNAIKLIEEARRRRNVTVMTFTQSANNPIQSLSDIDIYVFADPVIYRNVDLSSRVSMFGIVELLAYHIISSNAVNTNVTH